MSATASTLLDALIARAEAHAALDAARAAVDVALAAHFAAHQPTPPVDEADVETLAGDLFAARWPGQDWTLRAGPQQQDYRTQARTLIADGWAKR